MADPQKPDPTAQQSVTDAKKDVNDLVVEARQDVKSEVDAAASMVSKLLQHAAGDVKPLFTESEQAASSFVLSKLPAQYAGAVGAFLQMALMAGGAPAEAAVDKLVLKGLAYAQAEIASAVHHLDAMLG